MRSSDVSYVFDDLGGTRKAESQYFGSRIPNVYDILNEVPQDSGTTISE